jgi:hypothetical protein
VIAEGIPDQASACSSRAPTPVCSFHCQPNGIETVVERIRDEPPRSTVDASP